MLLGGSGAGPPAGGVASVESSVISGGPFKVSEVLALAVLACAAVGSAVA